MPILYYYHFLMVLIHSLRETMGFGKKLDTGIDYHYLDTNGLREHFIQSMRGHHFSEEILIQDYTLMTFLIGNDFIPKLDLYMSKMNSLKIYWIFIMIWLCR